jgi:hypothetical protein
LEPFVHARALGGTEFDPAALVACSGLADLKALIC